LVSEADGSSDKARSGIERPGGLERYLQLIPIPYSWVCVIWALIFSPIGTIPFVILDARTPEGAYKTVLSVTGLQGVPDPLPELAVYLTVFIALVFFIIYYLAYLRQRIIRAEPELSPVLSKVSFHRSFDSVTSRRWPLVIAIFVLAQNLSGAIFASIFAMLGPIAKVDFVILVVFLSFASADFIWVYARSLWGLYKIGKESLTLTSYQEDDMLGVRPLGTLSLSISLGFSGVLGLLLLLIAVAPIASFREPSGLFGFAVLVLVVLLFFVLPLYSIHQKMVAEKQHEKAVHRAEYRKLLKEIRDGSPPHAGDVSRLEAILMHDLTEKRISAIPTWPFDTSILGRLTAILLSVTAIILSAGLRDFLKF
jgi:hypothetical protein